MAQGLRAFAVVAEVLGLVPSTYMKAYTTQDAGNLMFSSGLPTYQAHIWCTNMKSGKNTHTGKRILIKKIFRVGYRLETADIFSIRERAAGIVALGKGACHTSLTNSGPSLGLS